MGGAALTALNKKCGGIRPVAVGKIIRRLVGKALLAEVKEDIATALGPNQFGVGAEGGSQRVAHIMRRLFDSRQGDEDFVVCKFDLQNAFNSGLRQKMLNAVAKLLPGLLP